jgi:hypothetical protein
MPRRSLLVSLLALVVPVVAVAQQQDTVVVVHPDSVVQSDSVMRPDSVARLDSIVQPDSAPDPATFCAALDSTPLIAPAVYREKVPLVPVPTPLRGLYVNRWAAIGHTVWRLIDVAKRTEVNALVIDVKDDRGYVLYRSRVPLASEIGADTTQPMTHARLRAMLDTMRAHDILPIARIVVIKDPLLARAKPGWAIKRKVDGQPWLDSHGNPWLDPHQDGPWAYAAKLACEAVDLGFSEVQFDYVRFPDSKRLIREAEFPLAHGRERADVIHDQLALLRSRLAPLGVPVTADIFGLTTSDTTDMGIGQRWERLVTAVDVVHPMMYPSHYAPGTYGIPHPNASPYAVIDSGLKDAKRRSDGLTDPAKVIPWYQDFTMGPPHYSATQVRAQMTAGYDNGVMGWILWNPGSHYTLDALRPAEKLARFETPTADSASTHK